MIKNQNQTQTQIPLSRVPKRTSTIRDQEAPTATDRWTLADMEVEAAMTMILQTTRMTKETIKMTRTTDKTEMTVKMRMIMATTIRITLMRRE